MRFESIPAALLLSALVGLAMSKPPGDGKGEDPLRKEKGTPPRFVLGRIFPPLLWPEPPVPPVNRFESHDKTRSV